MRVRQLTPDEPPPIFQFFNYSVNSLPDELDMVIAVHNSAPEYSLDTLCEPFRAIALRKGLRTAKNNGGTSGDPIAPLANNPST